VDAGDPKKAAARESKIMSMRKRKRSSEVDKNLGQNELMG
jgi:hypothetical protein